ncbi:hypothetical protein LGK95_01290 [Clostridium algoriphilum]|uniref:hypothetical protein n=1 Tax=Clostridium algoriphilum TaxID=198347 RepID=UPI001CF17E3E|nr:hypothetical protein [Clostridium algoriphilum]MCB2292170.1 hypothetical protein [Clostridium algoriphilum]
MERIEKKKFAKNIIGTGINYNRQTFLYNIPGKESKSFQNISEIKNKPIERSEKALENFKKQEKEKKLNMYLES